MKNYTQPLAVNPLNLFKGRLPKLLFAMLLAVLVLANFTEPVDACVQREPIPPPVWIKVDPNPLPDGRISVWLVFHDFTSFAANVGQNCACGLTITNSIDEVVSAEVTKPDGTVLPFGFVNNPTTAASFSNRQAGNWVGFAGPVQNTIASGLNVDVKIHVILKLGVTPVQLRQELKGGNIFMGVAEANPDGTLTDDEDHIYITELDPTTSIDLASFSVEADNGTATVTWETGTEIDNAGFNLYRATSPDGPWLQINAQLIPAEGDPVSGASYTFVDQPGRGTFYYQLEDIDYYLVSTQHDLIEIDMGSPVRLPWYRPALNWLGF